MKRMMLGVAAAMAVGSAAQAVVVNPDSVVALNGTTAALSPYLLGGSPGGTTRFFEVRDSSNNVVFSGTLLLSFTDANPFGRRYISMRLQGLNGQGGRSVVGIELSGYGLFNIDTNHRTDFAPALFPDKVTRSEDGDTLRYDFPVGVTPGQNSQFVYIFTQAPALANTGTGRILLNTGEVGTITDVPVPVNPQACQGDTNGDGVINFADLNSVLTNFGDDCP
jgi:opacity protein-like surface antigen